MPHKTSQARSESSPPHDGLQEFQMASVICWINDDPIGPKTTLYFMVGINMNDTKPRITSQKTFHPGAAPPAWLSSVEHGLWTIESALTIGRSPSCELVIDDRRVSRKHAAIHPNQNLTEFWISDLGGRNGVRVNKHRIQHATRLWHGDEIRLLEYTFRFFAPNATRQNSEPGDSSIHTLPDCRVENRWLLVADIKDGTGWASKMSASQYPLKLDRWFGKCRRVVERSNGTINNYVGDGFLADWADGPNALTEIPNAIKEFRQYQDKAEFQFRLVLHYGEVSVSSVGTVGEESLLGPDVNYVFRMEKVAAESGIDLLISESAGQRLSPAIKLFRSPNMDIPSFGSDHAFFTLPD